MNPANYFDREELRDFWRAAYLTALDHYSPEDSKAVANLAVKHLKEFYHEQNQS